MEYPRPVPGGVIGNTRDFGSLVPGSSPGRVVLVIACHVVPRRVRTLTFLGVTDRRLPKLSPLILATFRRRNSRINLELLPKIPPFLLPLSFCVVSCFVDRR